MKSDFKPKKILVVSQYYYPDVTAAAFRIKETVDILAGKGHQVSVIAAAPHRGEVGQAQPIDDGPVKVIRVPIIKYVGKGKWNYILHYCSFMLNAIIASFLLPERPQIVWASSPPLFVGIAGFFIARLRQAVFTLDIRDIWPDSAVVVGQLRRESFLYKVAKIVEKFLYRKASFMSCVAEPMADYIAQNARGKKPLVVYNAIPEKYLIPNPEKREKIIHLIDPEKINIMYVGNMGYCQNLNMVLDAARHLKREGNETIRFLLIGTGVERPELERRIREEQLTRVTIAGPVSKEEAMELMRSSSALFLQLKEDGTMEKTIPSKVFDYMAAGKPILYGLKGEGERILAGIPGNLAFTPDSSESFVRAVKIVGTEYAEWAESAKANITVVREKFVRETLVDRLEKELSTLVR